VFEKVEGVHFERVWFDFVLGKVFCLFIVFMKEVVMCVYERVGYLTIEVYEVLVEIT